MAYRCIRDSQVECSGCMCCKPEPTYYCPICGDEILYTVYVANDGTVIGCENCAKEKDPSEVFYEKS